MSARWIQVGPPVERAQPAGVFWLMPPFSALCGGLLCLRCWVRVLSTCEASSIKSMRKWKSCWFYVIAKLGIRTWRVRWAWISLNRWRWAFGPCKRDGQSNTWVLHLECWPDWRNPLQNKVNNATLNWDRRVRYDTCWCLSSSSGVRWFPLFPSCSFVDKRQFYKWWCHVSL